MAFVGGLRSENTPRSTSMSYTAQDSRVNISPRDARAPSTTRDQNEKQYQSVHAPKPKDYGFYDEVAKTHQVQELPPRAEVPPKYTIQVVASSNRALIRQKALELQEQFPQHPVFIYPKGSLFTILVGTFKTEKDMKTAKQKIQKKCKERIFPVELTPPLIEQLAPT